LHDDRLEDFIGSQCKAFRRIPCEILEGKHETIRSLSSEMVEYDLNQSNSELPKGMFLPEVPEVPEAKPPLNLGRGNYVAAIYYKECEKA